MGLTLTNETTLEGNELNMINIIWIDSNVDNEENTCYLKFEIIRRYQKYKNKLL